MEAVENVYSALRELGLTRSQYDFSERWLGQCQSYYSAMKARGAEPSVRSLLFLDHQLQLIKSALARTHNSAYAGKGTKRLTQVREAVSLRLRQRVTS